ncbi:hypothetical protein ACLOAV_008270 [Pseudogymnoascus australis]
MPASYARGFSTAARLATKSEGTLSKGAKKDPELYVLMAVMLTAAGGVGYFFGANPTSGTSEARITTVPSSKPWEQPNSSISKGDFKYKYHPGGNPANPPRYAPSALHSAIVPNVNLPKKLHEKYNKWGKDGF